MWKGTAGPVRMTGTPACFTSQYPGVTQTKQVGGGCKATWERNTRRHPVVQVTFI